MAHTIEQVNTYQVKITSEEVSYETWITYDPSTGDWNLELIDKGEVVDTAKRYSYLDILAVAESFYYTNQKGVQI